MYVTDCFAYTDITAEVRQHEDIFVVKLQTKKGVDISVTLNYMQVKILADGLIATVNLARIKALSNSTSSDLFGDMKVKLDILQPTEEVDNQEGESNLCQPNILSAQTEKIHLSQTA